MISSPGSRLRIDLAIPGSRSSGTLPRADAGIAVASDSEADFMTESEFRASERANLVAALRYAGGRIWGPRGAAALLGIKPSTLTYRMRKFDIEKPKASG